MAAAHWAYGHNVSGYIPEDDPGHVATWEDARSGLMYELERERDSCESETGDADLDAREDARFASLQCAMDELDRTVAGQEFLAYTDDGGQHTIPTAWWVNICAEDECEVDGE